jgi:hypothetical protein
MAAIVGCPVGVEVGTAVGAVVGLLGAGVGTSVDAHWVMLSAIVIKPSTQRQANS